MRSISKMKMLLALVVLCICAQSCEKDNLGENHWRKKKKTEHHDSTKNDSTDNDSTKNDSTDNDSTDNDSTDNDSTENDSTENDSAGNGGGSDSVTPGFLTESFMDSVANTFDQVSYGNPVVINGITYYQRMHNVYEWFGIYPPSSVSNLKKINSYTESDLYYWNSDYGMWMRK